MPAWSATTQTALSSGENLQVLLSTEAIAANAGLKGFSFTPQPQQIVLSVLNNSGQTLTLQKSVDGITWLTVPNVSFLTATASDYVVATGVNYRLMNSVAIVAGGAVWVSR